MCCYLFLEPRINEKKIQKKERDKRKIQNSTVYFWLIKALLAKKVQLKEENSKLNI